MTFCISECTCGIGDCQCSALSGVTLLFVEKEGLPADILESEDEEEADMADKQMD